MALTLLLLMDDRKCFEEVRGMRWPMGVRCQHDERILVIASILATS